MPSFGLTRLRLKNTQSDEPRGAALTAIGGCSDDQVYCDGFTEAVSIQTCTRPLVGKRYNFAPAQPVPIIRQHPKESRHEPSLARRGLIRSLANDASGWKSLQVLDKMLTGWSSISATIKTAVRLSRGVQRIRLEPRRVNLLPNLPPL